MGNILLKWLWRSVLVTFLLFAIYLIGTAFYDSWRVGYLQCGTDFSHVEHQCPLNEFVPHVLTNLMVTMVFAWTIGPLYLIALVIFLFGSISEYVFMRKKNI